MSIALQDLSRIKFGQLRGWRDDGLGEAFEAFRRSALRAQVKPYRTGSLGVVAATFEESFEEARNRTSMSHREAREFFERHFVPCTVPPGGGGGGLVTGFYEPEADASFVPTPLYRFPIYGHPPDLMEIENDIRPAGLDPSFRFARRHADGSLGEYWDRQSIEQGAISGRGLELAWLRDRVDLFFIHVQGAARLRMVDGSLRRVTYAAKSGHPFTGIGRVLADLGEIPLPQVTMQSIRAWLRDNPERVDEILWRNRSFIFFRDAPVDELHSGPVAAAKVPLTAGRSIAVDRLIHTFGTPFWIDAPTLGAFGGESGFARLMIAQDTGSAIVGAARGDLFAGSGPDAGEIAGVVRHPATFVALLPRALFGDGR